jgi:hypothetical protein
MMANERLIEVRIERRSPEILAASANFHRATRDPKH